MNNATILQTYPLYQEAEKNNKNPAPTIRRDGTIYIGRCIFISFLQAVAGLNPQHTELYTSLLETLST